MRNVMGVLLMVAGLAFGKNPSTNTAIGFAAAVRKAVALDSDSWSLYLNVPEISRKPGRFASGTSWPAWAYRVKYDGRDHTSDEQDAAVMRLCLDDSDYIRNLYLTGFAS